MALRRFLLGLVVCCSFAGACGGDDDDSGSGGGASGGGASGGSTASVASCNAQCEAQEKVRGTGCDPFVDLATCKQICAQLVKGIKGCGAEFNAYYDCSAEDGFQCSGSLVTNKTNACDDELDALNTCTNGGSSGPACKG